MQIKSNQLSHQLQKNIAQLYTLFGNEPLLIAEATDLIRASATQQNYNEREVFTVDHRFDWDELQQANNNLSLFGDKRVMDIRIPSGKPGREGGKAIEAYCQTLPQDTITLVTLPRIDKQGQSSKWFKALEKAGVTVPFYPVERTQLPAWIEQRLIKQQQSTNTETLQFLADCVEGNLLAAHQEISKLALLYPVGKLSFEQVKDAVLEVARYDVFKLSEAMISGNTARYVRILEELKGEGTAPPLILATLAEQIRSLLLIRKGLDAGKPMMQLLRETRVWGERQRLMENAARRIGSKSLTSTLLLIAKIDRISKGVAKGDTWDELLQLGFRFK